MKILIENTDQIIELVTPSGAVPCRLWVGKTENGADVQLMVTRVAVGMDQDQAEFERELKETEAPTPAGLWMAFPLRMVL